MTTHIDDLYYERLPRDEYIRMFNSIYEFQNEIIDHANRTSLLWTIGIDSDGDEVDCLNLQFEFPDRNPSRVDFPIFSIRSITGASLYARYIRAMECTSPIEEGVAH